MQKIIITLIAVASIAAVANAFCCNRCDSSTHCQDGTRCAEFHTGGCCATGPRPCNIFCCNCDGQCRHFFGDSNVPPQEENYRTAFQRFNLVDRNEDGKIDFSEFLDIRNVELATFQELDADGDGGISIEELDEDAGIYLLVQTADGVTIRP